ncbi:MAG: ribonuclease HI family protein [Candidatus Omnitrophica bacterium]|nr:ribonuclease HI family protein [Candidatus Omnitrophota bacterium]
MNLDSALEIYIDGAAKGNPGPAGVGVVVSQDGVTLNNISAYIGETTNNLAEYTALIYGLQEALILKAKNVKVFTDSQLLARQLAGEYKVKDSDIKILYNQAKHIISSFENISVKHISRQENKGADKLANLAIKKARANKHK